MKKTRGYLVTAAAAAVFMLPILFGVYTCPIQAITGFPCPGCGMTRAALALLQLDFARAFAMHPGVYVLIGWCLVWLVSYGLNRAGHTNSLYKSHGMLIILAVALAGIYVVRMVLYFPHTAPMVYNTDSLLYKLYQAVFGFSLY